jgi:hypothetical protein
LLGFTPEIHPGRIGQAVRSGAEYPHGRSPLYGRKRILAQERIMAEEEKEDKKEEVEDKDKEEAGADAKATETGKNENAETVELPKLTVREIEKMNVPKLKEAALQYSGRIEGVHGMDKGKLIRALREVNDLPLQKSKRASQVDRTSLKQKIKTLKKERDRSIETKNQTQLQRVRRRTKALRRKLARNA